MINDNVKHCLQTGRASLLGSGWDRGWSGGGGGDVCVCVCVCACVCVCVVGGGGGLVVKGMEGSTVLYR